VLQNSYTFYFMILANTSLYETSAPYCFCPELSAVDSLSWLGHCRWCIFGMKNAILRAALIFGALLCYISFIYLSCCGRSARRPSSRLWIPCCDGGHLGTLKNVVSCYITLTLSGGNNRSVIRSSIRTVESY
jgi:hypothetical protein